MRIRIKALIILFVLMIHVSALAEGVEVTIEDKLIIEVNILGQVKKPGSYKMEYGSNIVEAITKAGGMNDYADMKKLQIVRYVDGEKTMIDVDLKKFFKKNDDSDLPQLQDGDIIMVNKNIRKGWTTFVSFVSQLAIIINVFYLISKDI